MHTTASAFFLLLLSLVCIGHAQLPRLLAGAAPGKSFVLLDVDALALTYLAPGLPLNNSYTYSVVNEFGEWQYGSLNSVLWGISLPYQKTYSVDTKFATINGVLPLDQQGTVLVLSNNLGIPYNIPKKQSAAPMYHSLPNFLPSVFVDHVLGGLTYISSNPTPALTNFQQPAGPEKKLCDLPTSLEILGPARPGYPWMMRWGPCYQSKATNVTSCLVVQSASGVPSSGSPWLVSLDNSCNPVTLAPVLRDQIHASESQPVMKFDSQNSLLYIATKNSGSTHLLQVVDANSFAIIKSVTISDVVLKATGLIN